MTNHLYSGLFPSDRDKSAVSLIHPDGRLWSYAELDTQAALYASAIESLGVVPGDRVLVQVEKSPEALFLYLGCIRSGAVFVPLNTAYTAREVAYFVGDSEPATIVCRPQDAEGLGAIAAAARVRNLTTLDADGSGSLSSLARAQTGRRADASRGPGDLAAILYTSGTTGRSKGAMLSHANLRSNAEVLIPTWQFTAEDRLIHCLPIFHTHGLFVGINVSLMAGAQIVLLPRFDAREVLAWMPKSSVMMGVPTFYTRLLEQPDLTQEQTAAMRLFISGSAPLLAETHKAFFERCGHAILERYGMTETGMNTSNPYEGIRLPGSVGYPLAGVDIRICDAESGRELDDNEVGMIEVRGPNVFSGYWRMPEKTMSEFRPDGFFITGDLGKIDERGYVWILGRGKDLVITGGYNVYPKEIELEIDALPGVIESAVIGIPHPDFGEAVVAIVVAEPGAAVDDAGVIESLTGRLAKFKLPKRAFIVDELPRNAMAKVQKNMLRDQYKDLFS